MQNAHNGAYVSCSLAAPLETMHGPQGRPARSAWSRHPPRPYEPPELSDLGSLAELTLKVNSFADGTTFGTIDVGEPTS